jgi:hypothetical protein
MWSTDYVRIPLSNIAQVRPLGVQAFSWGHVTKPVASFSQIYTVLKSKCMYGYFSGLCPEIGDCGRSVLNIVIVRVVWSTVSVRGEHATLWMGELSGFDSWQEQRLRTPIASRPVLGLIKPHIWQETWAVYRGIRRLGPQADHFYTVVMVKNYGVVRPLHHTTSRRFA